MAQNFRLQLDVDSRTSKALESSSRDGLHMLGVGLSCENACSVT